MRISGRIVVALALALSGTPALGKGMQLPEETEIPDDYATLLCPDLAAGRDEGHDAHPRNVLERFLATSTQNGLIVVTDGERSGYTCQTPDGAIAVVNAMSPPADSTQQFAALQAGLTEHGCMAVAGEFRVTAWHGDVYIESEYEADERWTALSAVDQNGRTIGLIYDASPFR